ncbi:MAG: BlaI/MecI/CopY family transcriptional regulator [Lachnospiraceae bacterium]|nr:BlaI/MecI/CopY family transcriptional regulator [Lachnospiraceae bacterium]
MEGMERNYRVSDSEMEVMKMLWRQKEGIKQSQLLDLFTKEGKEWKRQTLNTFLSRLETKGLVIRERGLVRAAVEEEEYNFSQAQNAIDNMYGGKLSNFVAAFIRRNAVNKEDLEELNVYLTELENK